MSSREYSNPDKAPIDMFPVRLEPLTVKLCELLSSPHLIKLFKLPELEIDGGGTNDKISRPEEPLLTISGEPSLFKSINRTSKE